MQDMQDGATEGAESEVCERHHVQKPDLHPRGLVGAHRVLLVGPNVRVVRVEPARESQPRRDADGRVGHGVGEANPLGSDAVKVGRPERRVRGRAAQRVVALLVSHEEEEVGLFRRRHAGERDRLGRTTCGRVPIGGCALVPTVPVASSCVRATAGMCHAPNHMRIQFMRNTRTQVSPHCFQKRWCHHSSLTHKHSLKRQSLAACKHERIREGGQSQQRTSTSQVGCSPLSVRERSPKGPRRAGARRQMSDRIQPWAPARDSPPHILRLPRSGGSLCAGVWLVWVVFELLNRRGRPLFVGRGLKSGLD